MTQVTNWWFFYNWRSPKGNFLKKQNFLKNRTWSLSVCKSRESSNQFQSSCTQCAKGKSLKHGISATLQVNEKMTIQSWEHKRLFHCETYGELVGGGGGRGSLAQNGVNKVEWQHNWAMKQPTCAPVLRSTQQKHKYCLSFYIFSLLHCTCRHSSLTT